MRTPAALLAVLALTSAACSSSPTGAGTAATVDVSPPPPATAGAPPPANGPPAPPPPPSSPPADVAGAWASPSCGSRSYERILDLRPDGTFTATDRVSPCPPGARCVWSGIVTREGTWASSGGQVTLTVTRDAQGPAGQPLPAALGIDGAALVEEAGGARCPYTRR